MKVGLFLGTFDPVHEGHVRVMLLALELLDELVVVVGDGNPAKSGKRALFEVDERVEMLRAVVPERVRVEAYTGDVVEQVAREKATHFVRGMREPEDTVPTCRLGKEIAAALPTVRTISFLTTDGPEASSSALREALTLGSPRPTHCFPIVWERMAEKRRRT